MAKDEIENDDFQVYEEERLSIITPVGYNISTCGYCSEPGIQRSKRKKTSKSYGFWAYNLTPEAYQSMIDHGWRRSGQYVYRPDNGESGTCCAQLAIRLNVKDFKINKQQRSAINFLHHYVRISNLSSKEDNQDHHFTSKSLSKGKYANSWDIEERWKMIEWQEDEMDKILLSSVENKKLIGIYHNERSKEGQRFRKGEIQNIQPPLLPRKRRLKVTLHIANSSDEKYQLFRKYQANIHQEGQDEISTKVGFERFLCNSPFLPTLIGSKDNQLILPSSDEKIDLNSLNPIHFGLYHMEWRLDDRLIAVGVLDILPRCISSVYFFYDPDQNHLQLGKISAIREIALVRQIQRKKGMNLIQYYNMGLYIHSCAKMRYKAQFKPSQLLDPKSSLWINYDEILQLLDQGIRYDFSNEKYQANDRKEVVRRVESNDEKKVEESIQQNYEDDENDDEDEDGKELPRPLPPGIEDPTQLSFSEIENCAIFQGGKVYPLPYILPHLSRSKTKKCLDCLGALGPLRKHICMII